MRTRSLLVVGLALFAGSLVPASSVSAITYEILIENLIPGGMATGNPLTPPVAVVHDASYSLFMPGGTSSPGLEVVAEEGMPGDLVSEAESDGGVSSVVVGGGPFFDMMVLSVEAEPGDLFSVVTMLARSNDLITGVHDIVLPDTDEVVMMTNAYDAGTEQNTGLVADIPFYGNTFVGPEEDAPISMITEYAVLDDPGGRIDYTFPPVARITITPKPSTPAIDTSWGDLKARFGR